MEWVDPTLAGKKRGGRVRRVIFAAPDLVDRSDVPGHVMVEVGLKVVTVGVFGIGVVEGVGG